MAMIEKSNSSVRLDAYQREAVVERAVIAVQVVSGPSLFLLGFVGLDHPDLGCGGIIQLMVVGTVVISLLAALIVATYSYHSFKDLNRSALESRKMLEYRLKRKQQEANRQESELVRKRQLRRVLELEAELGQAPALSKRLVSEAEQFLRRAESEYGERAYGPFWDYVEYAADRLGRYEQLLQRVAAIEEEIPTHASDSRRSIHAFLSTTDFPDPGETISQLVKVTRKGQTDFQFASIWESRQTREVLIAGFDSLGAAINGLGRQLEDSFAALQRLVEDSSDQVRVSLRNSETGRKLAVESVRSDLTDGHEKVVHEIRKLGSRK